MRDGPSDDVVLLRVWDVSDADWYADTVAHDDLRLAAEAGGRGVATRALCLVTRIDHQSRPCPARVNNCQVVRTT